MRNIGVKLRDDPKVTETTVLLVRRMSKFIPDPRRRCLHFRHDQLIGMALIYVGNIPVEDISMFFHKIRDVGV